MVSLEPNELSTMAMCPYYRPEPIIGSYYKVFLRRGLQYKNRHKGVVSKMNNTKERKYINLTSKHAAFRSRGFRLTKDLFCF